MLTVDQQAALSALTLRIGAIPFKTYKQFLEFRTAMLKVMAKKGDILHEAYEREQAQKAKDKAAQKVYQDQFRLAWCKANLKSGDVVKTTHTVGAYVVGQLFEDEATLFRGGKNSTIVPFSAIVKIQIGNEWKDIYKLAAKG